MMARRWDRWSAKFSATACPALLEREPPAARLAGGRKPPGRAGATAIRCLGQSGVRVSGGALGRVEVRAQAGLGYGHAGYDYRAYRKYYAA